MGQYNRKFDGAPASERRKAGTDAVIDVRKLPPHKQPREYVLTCVQTTLTVHKTVTKYKTKAQMMAGEVEIRKKIKRDNELRRRWGWRNETEIREKKLEFEYEYPCSENAKGGDAK